jgi:hypothetical protein
MAGLVQQIKFSHKKGNQDVISSAFCDHFYKKSLKTDILATFFVKFVA